MPTHYPNTNTAIYSNTGLINDIAISYYEIAISLISLVIKSFMRQLPDMPVTVEMFITGYPKVW